MRYQVAIEVEGGLVPVSGPVSYSTAVHIHDQLRNPRQSLPVDRSGKRLSIVVLRKLKAEPPGQCLLFHPTTV